MELAGLRDWLLPVLPSPASSPRGRFGSRLAELARPLGSFLRGSLGRPSLVATRPAVTAVIKSHHRHAGGGRNFTRPGTMPYPVTVTLDSHGGDPDQKATWAWPVDARQRIDASAPRLLFNDVGAAGTLINSRARGDSSLGGFDGGSGGCRCEWVNFIAKRSSTPT